jgi:hypothetical protein
MLLKIRKFATSFDAGYSCGLYGASCSNATYGVKWTPEQKADWEDGKKAGQEERQRQQEETKKQEQKSNPF